MLRIGNGQGFWGDRPSAPAELVLQQPDLDYLTLDYLSEIAMGILAIQQKSDPERGYVPDFVSVVRSLVPLWREGVAVKVITNAGGLNPRACAKACQAALEEEGYPHKRIGVITGEEVTDQLLSHLHDPLYCHLETSDSLRAIQGKLTGAYAYLGAPPIVEALHQGADIVITGRVADVSLTVAPCIAHFDWPWDAYDKLASASVAGHLIECGTQVSGGMSTNWLSLAKKTDMANIGYPYVEIDEDASFVITKPKYTGGAINEQTVKEQLLYEIGDPNAFITPDVTVSLTLARLQPEGENRIRVLGISGKVPTETFKVSASFTAGYRCDATVAIFGRHASEKAQTCGQVILDRVKQAGYHIDCFCLESLGDGHIVPGCLFHSEGADPIEVTMRLSVASEDKAALNYFSKEIASTVTWGPQGVTCYATGRPKIRPMMGYWPCLIPKNVVKSKVEMFS